MAKVLEGTIPEIGHVLAGKKDRVAKSSLPLLRERLPPMLRSSQVFSNTTTTKTWTTTIFNSLTVARAYRLCASCRWAGGCVYGFGTKYICCYPKKTQHDFIILVHEIHHFTIEPPKKNVAMTFCHKFNLLLLIATTTTKTKSILGTTTTFSAGAIEIANPVTHGIVDLFLRNPNFSSTLKAPTFKDPHVGYLGLDFFV